MSEQEQISPEALNQPSPIMVDHEVNSATPEENVGPQAQPQLQPPLERSSIPLPVADLETGIYTDGNGEQWGTKKAIGSTNTRYIQRKINSIRTLTGMSGPFDALLYNMGDANKVISYRDSLPKVDPESKVYIDGEGKRYGGAGYFGSKNVQYLRDRNVVGIEGRSKGGQESILYDLEEAERLLAERDTSPQVNDGGLYVDNNGEEWVSAQYFRDSDEQFLRNNIDKIKTIEGRSNERAKGIPSKLFNLKEAKALLTDRRTHRPAGYWDDPSHVEEEVRAILAENIPLTHTALQNSGKSYLSRALVKSYPGGIHAVRENLGLGPQTVSPDQADELMKGLEEEI